MASCEILRPTLQNPWLGGSNSRSKHAFLGLHHPWPVVHEIEMLPFCYAYIGAWDSITRAEDELRTGSRRRVGVEVGTAQDLLKTVSTGDDSAISGLIDRHLLILSV
jgi:hypothetical protein